MALFSSSEVNYRINDGASVSIQTWAGIFDLFSIIPFLNFATAVVGGLVVWWALRSRGIRVFSTRLKWRIVLAIIAELIPVISTLPSFWMFSKFAIHESRKEDERRAQEKNKDTEQNIFRMAA